MAEYKVKDLAPRYLEYIKVYYKNFAGVSSYVRWFVRDHGKMKVTEIVPLHLTVWVSNQESWGESSKAGAFKTITRMFKWFVTQRLLAVDPFVGVRCPWKVKSRGDEALISPEEHAKLLAGTQLEGQRVLRFLHGTGARPSELVMARREHWNTTLRALVYKDQAKTKNRVIYFPEDLAKEVDEIFAVRTILLVNRKCMPTRPQYYKPTQMPYLQAWFSNLKKRVGITRKELTLYCYRHTFATEALLKGIPTLTVAKLLGHTSSASLEKHYAHLLNRDLTGIINQFRGTT